ncbi:MAG: hypothetical protein QM688_01420 [Sphingomonas bacterium]
MAGYRFPRFAASVALAALALAGCNRSASDTSALLNNQSAAAPLPALPATLPMTDTPATQSVTAPPVTRLPETRPIRTVRVRDASHGADYAYSDAAWQFSDALGEAPPDYGFDYQGVQPWAWQGYDDSVVFAEPVSGGYRTYYYRPGADEPYFVRDPDHAYGYDDGQLAVVYAADGAIVPWADYGPQLVYASRYLTRGRDLWRASRQTRISISAQNWTVNRNTYFIGQQNWGAGRTRQPMWAAYAQRNAPAQSHWQVEQTRRAADIHRFADWQTQGFRSAPPPRAIPVAWQQAPWAQDPRHFAPAAAAIAGTAAVAAGATIARDARLTQIREQQQAALQMQQRQQQAMDQQRVAAEQQQAAHQQQQARAAAQMVGERQQQVIRAEQTAIRRDQQQARAAQLTVQRQQQRAVRAEQVAAQREQLQARTQQVTIHREQQAEIAARQHEQQVAHAQQQQARAAQVAQHREQAAEQAQARAIQAAHHAEERAAHHEQPRPPTPPRGHPEHPHEHH